MSNTNPCEHCDNGLVYDQAMYPPLQACSKCKGTGKSPIQQEKPKPTFREGKDIRLSSTLWAEVGEDGSWTLHHEKYVLVNPDGTPYTHPEALPNADASKSAASDDAIENKETSKTSVIGASPTVPEPTQELEKQIDDILEDYLMGQDGYREWGEDYDFDRPYKAIEALISHRVLEGQYGEHLALDRFFRLAHPDEIEAWHDNRMAELKSELERED